MKKTIRTIIAACAIGLLIAATSCRAQKQHGSLPCPCEKNHKQ